MWSWWPAHVPTSSASRRRSGRRARVVPCDVADVAGLAVFLAGPAADYITGQTIPVDGGFLAGNPWPTTAQQS